MKSAWEMFKGFNMKIITIFLTLFLLIPFPGMTIESISDGKADVKSVNTKTPADNNIKLVPTNLIYVQQEGLRLKSPMGVFCDKKTGEIYVADTNNNMVAVYSKEGVPVYSFGYNNELLEPSKAVVDRRGRIYVLNGSPRVVKIFNFRGEYLSDFEFKGIEDLKSSSKIVPTAITVDSDGNLYFGITSSINQVVVYDEDFNLLFKFGKSGIKEGEFSNISDIAVDNEKNIYVVDSSAIPVQVFNKKGKFLRGWGQHSSGPENFSLPAGIAVTDDGKVVVVDQLRQDIKIFTKDGNFLGEFGGFGSWPGATAFPSDVEVDTEGRILVVEKIGNRLQIFSREQASKNNNKKVGEKDVQIRNLRKELAEVVKEIKNNEVGDNFQVNKVKNEIATIAGDIKKDNKQTGNKYFFKDNL